MLLERNRSLAKKIDDFNMDVISGKIKISQDSVQGAIRLLKRVDDTGPIVLVSEKGQPIPKQCAIQRTRAIHNEHSALPGPQQQDRQHGLDGNADQEDRPGAFQENHHRSPYLGLWIVDCGSTRHVKPQILNPKSQILNPTSAPASMPLFRE